MALVENTRVTRRLGHRADYLCARVCLSVGPLPPQGYTGQGGGEDVVRSRPGTALLHLPGMHRVHRRFQGELLHAISWGACALFLVSIFFSCVQQYGGQDFFVLFFLMRAVVVV